MVAFIHKVSLVPIRNTSLLKEEEAVAENVLAEAIAVAVASMPASKAASEIAKRFNLNRSDIYQRILDLKGQDGA